MPSDSNLAIQAAFFDFGGVLAEEGFAQGLETIAIKNNLDPKKFFEVASDLIFDSGYALGKGDEASYWRAIREKTGVAGSDDELRSEIFERFIMRPWMIDLVRNLRGRLQKIAILSDQTDWLDQLDRTYGFFSEFDVVFNSYYLGKSKRDASIFADVTTELGVEPRHALFVDDNEGHVGRARSMGLTAIHYTDREALMNGLRDCGLWP